MFGIPGFFTQMFLSGLSSAALLSNYYQIKTIYALIFLIHLIIIHFIFVFPFKFRHWMSILSNLRIHYGNPNKFPMLHYKPQQMQYICFLAMVLMLLKDVIIFIKYVQHSWEYVQRNDIFFLVFQKHLLVFLEILCKNNKEIRLQTDISDVFNCQVRIGKHKLKWDEVGTCM